MVMGCTSDAGKSFLVAALCRIHADRGLRGLAHLEAELDRVANAVEAAWPQA
jgi:cobyric acid synthase